MIGRREFITLLGGAAAWPLAARAQQGERVRRIGVLMGYSESDPEGQTRLAALQQGLRERGWSEGRNISFAVRWAAADPERIRALAEQLVSLRPDVIVANTGPVVAGLRAQTDTVPIIFVLLNDPVGAGFVPNLARPGGNITGFSAFEDVTSAKWPELLFQIAPRTSRVLLVANLETVNRAYLPSIETVTRAAKVELVTTHIRNAADIEREIATLAEQSNAGLIVLPGPFAAVNRRLILALAARYRMPAVYPFRFYAVDGGLISYGIDSHEIFQRSASYVERILKGEKPGDLPVQLPTKFELVINLKTAKTLGLEVPPMLLARADEVIE
jgi:ABC-type uncharacterized transport system substrate-binding protein